MAGPKPIWREPAMDRTGGRNLPRRGSRCHPPSWRLRRPARYRRSSTVLRCRSACREIAPCRQGPAGSRSRTGRCPRRPCATCGSAACPTRRPGGPSSGRNPPGSGRHPAPVLKFSLSRGAVRVSSMWASMGAKQGGGDAGGSDSLRTSPESPRLSRSLTLYMPRREAGRIMPGPCCRAHIYGVVEKHAIRRDAFPPIWRLGRFVPVSRARRKGANSRKRAQRAATSFRTPAPDTGRCSTYPGSAPLDPGKAWRRPGRPLHLPTGPMSRD